MSTWTLVLLISMPNWTIRKPDFTGIKSLDSCISNGNHTVKALGKQYPSVFVCREVRK